MAIACPRRRNNCTVPGQLNAAGACSCHTLPYFQAEWMQAVDKPIQPGPESCFDCVIFRYGCIEPTDWASVHDRYATVQNEAPSCCCYIAAETLFWLCVRPVTSFWTMVATSVKHGSASVAQLFWLLGASIIRDTTSTNKCNFASRVTHTVLKKNGGCYLAKLKLKERQGNLRKVPAITKYQVQQSTVIWRACDSGSDKCTNRPTWLNPTAFVTSAF